MTLRKNVIMGSFRADLSLAKWLLINERDLLFDNYCIVLDKLLKWQAPEGFQLAIGSREDEQKLSNIKMIKLIQKAMDEMSAKLVELDERISCLAANEPPIELPSQHDNDAD